MGFRMCLYILASFLGRPDHLGDIPLAAALGRQADTLAVLAREMMSLLYCVSSAVRSTLYARGKRLGISLGAVHLKPEARWRAIHRTGRATAGREHTGGEEEAARQM